MERRLKRNLNEKHDANEGSPSKIMKSGTENESIGLPLLIDCATKESEKEIGKDVMETMEFLIASVLEKEKPPKRKPGKSRKANMFNTDYLNNVVTHGDYQLYKDRLLNPTCCCICSGEVKDGQKIQCTRCPNIFHITCSGYGNIKLADYDCPHCSMKEVNICILIFIELRITG